MNIIRKIFQDKKNYYSIMIAIFLGVFLLLMGGSFLPKNDEEVKDVELSYIKSDNSVRTYEEALETKLEEILSKVDGVGIVDVMITLENGKELVTKDDSIQENSTTDEEALNGDKRQILTNKTQDTTVKINGDEPLIIKEISPKISGVLIVAQGGGNALIKNELINATNALLGVDIHKIEVLKMK